MRAKDAAALVVKTLHASPSAEQVCAQAFDGKAGGSAVLSLDNVKETVAEVFPSLQEIVAVATGIYLRPLPISHLSFPDIFKLVPHCLSFRGDNNVMSTANHTDRGVWLTCSRSRRHESQAA